MTTPPPKASGEGEGRHAYRVAIKSIGIEAPLWTWQIPALEVGNGVLDWGRALLSPPSRAAGHSQNQAPQPPHQEGGEATGTSHTLSDTDGWLDGGVRRMPSMSERRAHCPNGCEYSIAADWAGTRRCPRCSSEIPTDPPPKASTPDTPDFSPEAIAEAVRDLEKAPRIMGTDRVPWSWSVDKRGVLDIEKLGHEVGGCGHRHKVTTDEARNCPGLDRFDTIEVVTVRSDQLAQLLAALEAERVAHAETRRYDEEVLNLAHDRAIAAEAALEASERENAETARHWEIDRTLLDAANARHATTEAALTQALAERDGLREALTEARDVLKHATWVDVVTGKHATWCVGCKMEVQIDAALATAPNTKDGEG